MIDILSTDDRRQGRKCLIASLVIGFTLLLSTFTWAGGKLPSEQTRAPSLSLRVPAVQGPAEETTNATLGCGTAESCYACN